VEALLEKKVAYSEIANTEPNVKHAGQVPGLITFDCLVFWLLKVK